MTNFFCEVGNFLSSIFNCCNENRKGPNNPPAPTAQSPSANQSQFDDKEQEIMILILQNYNETLLIPRKRPKAPLFDGITTKDKIEIKEHIKKWNDDNYFNARGGFNFHEIFRKKLQKHLQEIQKEIFSKNEKNSKFDALISAIESNSENPDLDKSAKKIKDNLIKQIEDAKEGQSLGKLTR